MKSTSDISTSTQFEDNPVKNVSITFYCPIELKYRIDKAASADERSASKYLVRLMEKVVPPLTAHAQIDLEEVIESAAPKSKPKARKPK
jgi:hypothetical protein